MTYGELEAIFRRHLHFSHDPDELLITVSVILAQQLDAIPLWLMLVAPSGGGKSAILESGTGSSKVYLTDSLTSKTLISAYREGGKKPNPENSLLYKIDGKTLIVPDFMSITEMDVRERRAIFGQLRQAFSGRLQRDTGIGSVGVNSKFNMIAAGTHAIDKFRENETAMGERFIVYRSRQAGGLQLTMRAMSAMSDDLMALDLNLAMSEYLDETTILPEVPVLPQDVSDLIVRWSMMLVRLRNAVMWNTYTKQIDYPVVQAEEATRIVKQLKVLAYALIMVCRDGRRAMRVVAKVVVDCIPWPRWRLVQGLRLGVSSTEELRKLHVRTGREAFKRTMAEMSVLEIVRKARGVPVLSPEYEEFLDEICCFIDTPEQLARCRRRPGRLQDA